MNHSSTEPKISIVTPSFNQSAYLEEALWSVKNQNYSHLEHIIVDGASTDGSVDILRHYASLAGWGHLRWLSEPDRGQTNAINKGFRLATGHIFAYLCADDRYAPDAFHFVTAFFQHDSEVDLVYGECHFIDEGGTLVRRKKPVPFDVPRLLRSNCIWQPTVFFRSRVWQEVGPFNEQLDFAMDYEYWLRASRSCVIKNVDHHIAYYRWHRDSKTVSREREQLREAYRVSCEFGGGGPLSWYLHHIYWPNTSGFKRWLFPRLRFLHHRLKPGIARG